MGDERRAHSDFDEDVNLMIVEYLVYGTTEACLNDFDDRQRCGDAQPTQTVQTQIRILERKSSPRHWNTSRMMDRYKYSIFITDTLETEFLQTHRFVQNAELPGEGLCIWLELLELLILVIYRRSDTQSVKLSPAGRISMRRLTERRSHWLATREEEALISSPEYGISKAWAGLEKGLLTTIANHGQDGRQPAKFGTMSLLFFTVSARVARLTNKPLSVAWTKLAAQFMVQVALDSCMAAPAYNCTETGQLSLAFAWGWIPSRCWEKEDHDWIGKDEIQLELMISEMFASHDEPGLAAQENSGWTQTRLELLSRFDLSGEQQGDQSPSPPTQEQATARLNTLAEEYTMDAFEAQVVSFVKQIWELCEKPLLVQIEEGRVEGMSCDEFEEFKRRACLPL